MKKGVNLMDINQIKRRNAAGQDVEEIARAINVSEDVVAEYIEDPEEDLDED